MSSEAYNAIWNTAQIDMRSLLQVDLPEEPPKPEKDRERMQKHTTTMYIKYTLTYIRLEKCYDLIVHPQKRRLLRRTLEATIGRIIELKHELLGLDFSEYHYFDEFMLAMNLSPDDIELPIPKFFQEDNQDEFKEREKVLGSILAQIGPPDSESETSKEPPFSIEEAIRLIQIHERARQGRVRMNLMQSIQKQEERARLTKSEDQMTRDVSVVIVQKYFKGWLARKNTRILREKEFEFLGMVPPQLDPTQSTFHSQVDKIRDKRKTIQVQFEKDYIEALDTIKEKLRDTEGPIMKEHMMDQIRQWFIDVRDANGQFPDYPTEEEGGSNLIFKERTNGAEPEKQEEEKGKKGKKGKKDKKEKKEGKPKKGKEKKGKKGDDAPEGFTLAESKFAPTLQKNTDEYVGIWLGRDEVSNFVQKHDAELIKVKKRTEVEIEVRVQVDVLMREELRNLKIVVERDKGGKGKKGKAKKGKKKAKAKKGGKKGKKEKDLTPDRTIESIYQELVQEGIIIKYPKIRLRDYVGSMNYLASTLREKNHIPMPSLAEVRRVMTEYAILPMGSQVVHEQVPHVKSLMLGGPFGTGKKVLLHSVCTETQANLFDISPANLVGKYTGKQATTLLIHMVWKVARAMPPSIIWIDDCDKIFMKKVPKTDLTDPKRLKKDLIKSIKLLKPEHRVLVIGTTQAPFEAEIKAFCGFFQRLILLPRPDYSSRFEIWKSMVERRGARMKQPEVDFSTLSRVSDGFTPGHFNFALQAILTDRRMAQMHRKPLTPNELLAPLSKVQHIDVKMEQQFRDWYGKTPLGRKRAKLAAGGDDVGGGNEKVKKKGGKKKVKK